MTPSWIFLLDMEIEKVDVERQEVKKVFSSYSQGYRLASLSKSCLMSSPVFPWNPWVPTTLYFRCNIRGSKLRKKQH
jgi:hypothetical protein